MSTCSSPSKIKLCNGPAELYRRKSCQAAVWECSSADGDLRAVRLRGQSFVTLMFTYAAQVPPFAIVASRQMDTSVGRYWPVRRYPWGVCEALSSEHSDVAALKKLLLELCFEEFKVCA